MSNFLNVLLPSFLPPVSF